METFKISLQDLIKLLQEEDQRYSPAEGDPSPTVELTFSQQDGEDPQLKITAEVNLVEHLRDYL